MHRPIKEPLVSVVTPVYNRPMGIIECSQSLLAQTYQNWEHIVVDDCSTDETPKIISSATDFRIKPIFQETNQGPQFAYKRGFNEARGKYVFLNDSDDLSLPDRLQKCVAYLESHPQIDVLYHGLYRLTDHQSLPIKVWIYSPAPKWEQKRLEKEQYIPGAACVLRRELLKKYQPDNLAQGSWDWYFLLQLYFAGAKFAPLDEGLYIYTRSEDGLAQAHEKSGGREKSFDNIRRYIRKAKRLG